jgi:hypothetical protein
MKSSSSSAYGSGQQPSLAGRSSVISVVRTPLGFFTLSILVIEALFCILTFSTTGGVQITIVVGMIVTLLLLIGVVGFFAFLRPEALFGRRAPTSLRYLSSGLRQLLWHIRDQPASRDEIARLMRDNSRGSNGWDKAAVYGCYILLQSGYAQMIDDRIGATAEGRREAKHLMGTATPPRVDLSELTESERFIGRQDDRL